MLTGMLILVQLFFSIIIGLYFLNVLRNQQSSKTYLNKESTRELEKLKKMREIRLTEPLSERTRPQSFDEIQGQEQGLRALRAALCGPNPQHVIIYGPPGIGKTAAARVTLNEACKSNLSPFGKSAKFIEADAATLRFDERGIADPLIGSVHDPIYQGAGAYGPGGIPQPKPGAVTKAHGGILFIDEIGELHPIQINKLLKVLEDRKVLLESSYYSRDNKDIPRHIHDMFQKGLPADFRLVGATTRSPEEIPPAIRSRCTEIFFNPLSEADLLKVAKGAVVKGGFDADDDVISQIVRYSQNGRDAVNIVQTAGSFALCEGRRNITSCDVIWVAEAGRFTPKITHKPRGVFNIGRICGLAVAGASSGVVMEIEVVVKASKKGQGTLNLMGVIEEEEIEGRGRKLRRTGTAKAAAENAICSLREYSPKNPDDYNIHINFPGGFPADGPSAGVAMFTAIYSALNEVPIPDTIAITGEISAMGSVLPVGGVPLKVYAAIESGLNEVFIPESNFNESFENLNIKVTPISDVADILSALFNISYLKTPSVSTYTPTAVSALGLAKTDTNM